MLEAAGVPFECVDAALDENGVKASLRAEGATAAALALALAREKALAAKADAADLILGSDQILELDDSTMLDRARAGGEAI